MLLIKFKDSDFIVFYKEVLSIESFKHREEIRINFKSTAVEVFKINKISLMKDNNFCYVRHGCLKLEPV